MKDRTGRGCRTANAHAVVVGIILLFSSALVLCAIQEGIFKPTGAQPPAGFVPDEVTAVKVAEAIWLPLFGKDIYESWPFTAKLIGDSVWVVEGTLPSPRPGYVTIGAIPHAEIRKKDCRVLLVYFG